MREHVWCVCSVAEGGGGGGGEKKDQKVMDGAILNGTKSGC